MLPAMPIFLGVASMLTVWVLSLSLVLIACIELRSYGQPLQVRFAYAKEGGSHAVSHEYFVLLRGPSSLCSTCPSRVSSLFISFFFHTCIVLHSFLGCFVRVTCGQNFDGTPLYMTSHVSVYFQVLWAVLFSVICCDVVPLVSFSFFEAVRWQVENEHLGPGPFLRVENHLVLERRVCCLHELHYLWIICCVYENMMMKCAQ